MTAKNSFIFLIIMGLLLLCSCGSVKKEDKKFHKMQKKIVIGCYFLTDEINNQINMFKSENEDCDVIVKEYMDYTREELEEVDDVYLQFDKDMILGDVPDVMIFNSDMSIDNYIEKDLLCDLTPFFNNDKEIDIDDYMSNILSSFNRNSSLYVIPSEFYITGYVCSKDVVTDLNIDYDDVRLIQNENNIQNDYLFGLNTRNQVLINYLMHNGMRYIDEKNNTCNLKTSEFEDAMFFIKKCPKEFSSNDAFINDFYNAWAERKALFLNYSIGSFYDYAVAEQVYFKGNIKVTGFPGSPQKVPSIASDFLFAISDKSEQKELAWNFVSRFFKKNYQNSLTNSFPVARDSFLKLGEASQMNDFDDEVYNAGTNQEVIMKSLKEETVSEFEQMIEELDNGVFLDKNIINIILEDAEDYFDDKKDIETVINSMENRINIYINE